EPEAGVAGGGDLGSVGEPVVHPLAPRLVLLLPDRVGIDVAFKHHAVGLPREQRGVDGAEVGAVGLAPVGDLRHAEGDADAVHVAGGVGGGEVPQFVADLAAGPGDGLGGGDVLGDGAVSGGVGEGQTGADAAAHRVAVPDAAGVEPDQVVLVEDRGGQGR